MNVKKLLRQTKINSCLSYVCSIHLHEMYLITFGWGIHGIEICQDVYLMGRKHCGPMILPFLSLLKTWLMTQDHFLRLRHPGLYLIQIWFKFGLKMWNKPFSCKSQDLYSKSPFSMFLFWDLNLSSMSCEVSNLRMYLFRTQACSLNAVTREKGSSIFLSLCEGEIQTLVNPS